MNRSTRPADRAVLPHRTLTLAGVDRGNASMVLADVENLVGVHEVTLALGDNTMHLHVDERFDVAALQQILSSSGVTLAPVSPARLAGTQPPVAAGTDAASCCTPGKKDNRNGSR